MINVEKWKADLEMARRAKDEFFGSDHPQSPIPPMERQKLEGLAYYPPDPGYRFGLDLHEHKEKKRLKVVKGKDFCIRLGKEKCISRGMVKTTCR